MSVFGPFKKYCAAVQDAWLRNNPWKTLTIYGIPKIVADALPFAQTSINIVHDFRKTGIYPYNANIFGEDEFSPSFVTDRPGLENSEPGKNYSKQPIMSNTDSDPQGKLNRNQTMKKNESVNLIQVFSPEIVRPFPNAGARKVGTNNRRKRKAAILTDIPEKNALEEQQNKTTKNVKKNMDNKKKKVCKNFGMLFLKT